MIARLDTMLAKYESGAIDRRQFLTGVAALSAATAAGASSGAFRGTVINHVTLSVTDVERSRAFYQGLVGATLINPPADSRQPLRLADLRVGSSFIGLYPMGAPARIDHFCIGVDGFDPDRVMARLKQDFAAHRPEVVPQTGGAQNEVYLTDPDGLRVQLSSPTLKL